MSEDAVPEVNPVVDAMNHRWFGHSPQKSSATGRHSAHVAHTRPTIFAILGKLFLGDPVVRQEQYETRASRTAADTAEEAAEEASDETSLADKASLDEVLADMEQLLHQPEQVCFFPAPISA